ncbi:diguanylate cyclase [Alteromonas oceani]|uniref:diguanylate cyclase n=1 Tax=Alteromonas oceani TaxID=2071609 RepID=A0ABV7K405_9ALTE|nr:diguanylate cyclase [Alteromonas oceani]
MSISIRLLKPLGLLWLGVFACAVVHASETSWQTHAQPVFLAPLGNSTPLEGQIDTILEDQQGFIWLVAANGLWRWDSKSLVRAQFEGLDNEAPAPQVNHGFSDTKGRIWIGTSNGLFRLTPGTSSFTAVAPDQLQDITVQAGTVVSLPHTDIVILASDRALYQFDTASAQLEQLHIAPETRIHALHINQASTLWVGTDKGLYRSELTNSRFASLQAEPDFPAGIRVSSITTTTEEKLVVGTAAEGLFVQSESSGFSNYTLAEDDSPWLFTVTEIRPDVLLIGTFGDGLIELNLANQTTRRFRHNRLLPASLSDNDIWSLFRDSTGLVWIGSGATLNVYDAGDVAVSHIFGDSGQPEGLMNRKVHSVQAIGNKLIVGSGEHGLEEFTAEQGTTRQLWQNGTDPVETLVADPAGNLYASANFASVIIPPGSKQPLPLNVDGRNASTFTTALARSSEALWIGGTDGLWQQPATATEPTVQLLPEHFSERRVASLLATPDSLWVGSWQGLLHGRLTNGLLNSEDIKAVNHPRLAQQFIADLYADSLGQLWVATSGAGLFVHTTDNRWLEFTTAVGLPGDNVMAIAGESDKQIWVGTSRGIAAIDIEQKLLRVITAGPGAVNSPYSRAAATITAAGDLVFGGKNGLTIITPQALPRQEPPLSLNFTQLEIITADNHKVHPATTQAHIEISALPKRISFEFVALDYLDPEHLQYRYRLAGSENNWTQLDADHRIVTLTDPAPGEYTLELQYSDNGTTWQSTTLSQRFTVLPAWYQTIYASMASLLLLAIAIFVLHQLGLRHYRHRQNVLEQKIAERTAELLTANEKLSEQALALEKASLTDALTGLHNRRFLNQNMQRDVSRVHRYYKDCEATNTHPDNNSDMLFFIIDLDHFKRINDNHGHQAGDAVLVETQKRLSAIFRDSDYLVRWGGEEFLAVVQDTPREEAYLLAERIVNAVNASDMNINGHTHLRVTCSVGFAAYPLHQQRYSFFDWQSTVGIADAALYGAKRRNRDTWMGITGIRSTVSDSTLELIKQQPARIFDHANVLVRQ